jgi:hypothetical protein
MALSAEPEYVAMQWLLFGLTLSLVAYPSLAAITVSNSRGVPVTTEVTALNQSKVSEIGGCERPDPQVSKNKTVVERANDARGYERCMERTFGIINAATRQSEDVAAVEKIQRAVMTDVARLREDAEADEDFLGLKWGVGLGLSLGDDFVEEAKLVDGVVRVTKDNSDQARVVFEYHKLFWCNDQGKSAERGCGPFVAAAATEEDVLSGVGLGFMFGWRAPKAKPGDEGFAIGFGFVLDNDVKALADGFEEGQPLPAGETDIRVEEKGRTSFLLFVTRTF